MSKEFLDAVYQAKAHKQEFLLWPHSWKSYTCKIPFVWTTVKFDRNNKSKIPHKPGIYGFLIQPNIASSLNGSYLFYIGETERPLQVRFEEYLREKNKMGRPKIYRWLNQYDDFVYFTCAEVVDKYNLKEIEKDLLEALVPPANTQFPTSINKVVSAF